MKSDMELSGMADAKEVFGYDVKLVIEAASYTHSMKSWKKLTTNMQQKVFMLLAAMELEDFDMYASRISGVGRAFRNGAGAHVTLYTNEASKGIISWR